jgi:hypothetical protein
MWESHETVVQAVGEDPVLLVHFPKPFLHILFRRPT